MKNFYASLMTVSSKQKANSALNPYMNARLQLHEFCNKYKEFPQTVSFGGKSAVLLRELLKESKKAIITDNNGCRCSFYVVDGFYLSIAEYADITLEYRGNNRNFQACPVKVQVYDGDAIVDFSLFGE